MHSQEKEQTESKPVRFELANLQRKQANDQKKLAEESAAALNFWLTIKEDFIAQYGKDNINEKDQLCFSSLDQARVFFQEQAIKNRPFSALEMDADNKPTGKCFFSVGDGALMEADTLQEMIVLLQSKIANASLYSDQKDFINNSIKKLESHISPSCATTKVKTALHSQKPDGSKLDEQISNSHTL